MNENVPSPGPPGPSGPAEPERVQARQPERQRRHIWPLALGAVGFLVLAAGEGYLLRLQQRMPDYATPVAVLQAQVAALQQFAMRAQPAPDSITVQADLAQKYADLNAQVTALVAQSAADHAALQRLAAADMDLGKLTARMTLLAWLESARMALDAGQPLGAIPDAPPALAPAVTQALARYADTPPPTQAALLLAFPAAARAADIASVEKLNGVSYWSKVRARAENLITITEGDRVIIGPPAAGITAQARRLLEAGDLAGAVAELGKLSPSTQAAMGDWLPQARALLAARAALLALAGQD